MRSGSRHSPSANPGGQRSPRITRPSKTVTEIPDSKANVTNLGRSRGSAQMSSSISPLVTHSQPALTTLPLRLCLLS
ncbi:hypothetical protein LEMLEM_LOCUS3211 [Lemmus lemmus]